MYETQVSPTFRALEQLGTCVRLRQSASVTSLSGLFHTDDFEIVPTGTREYLFPLLFHTLRTMQHLHKRIVQLRFLSSPASPHMLGITSSGKLAFPSLKSNSGNAPPPPLAYLKQQQTLLQSLIRNSATLSLSLIETFFLFLSLYSTQPHSTKDYSQAASTDSATTRHTRSTPSLPHPQAQNHQQNMVSSFYGFFCRFLVE